MKYLVMLAFAAILLSLGSALFFMMKGGPAKDPDKSSSMVKALALRVGLSVLLFICILVSWKLGWIQPTGIAPGQ
ncbi:twin transmembrane helix small protein [Curvibacter sp. RS43]|uniref:Twin transmembrane helix small protein n=1 Tax=Curvibacter microcysteis TaxID=3026419 RepID=A0ABT5MH17_9BURK|nr:MULTISPECIES: twin transmembrane helix small protein [unclassified Curvibacter]MDD0812287.1 twin transmembrane helix small protein [Curvibacter sp. RS43]MDD0815891.1 twin transmembrane helix small protein [Curvibacter sp. HBC28]